MTTEQAVARLIEALEREGVPYMVVGAFSSNLYGVPRATNDADIVVQFDSFNLLKFCHELGTEFVLDRRMMIEGFTGSVRNVVTFRPTGFQIELFRLGEDPHHRERFQRRRRQHMPECSREAWVAAAEDVVIQKLRWARRKDLDDVVNLLAVSGGMLDWDYLRRWTDSHGTGDLLEQLRREAGA
ncbi:MAG: hypothetical protein WCC69_11470 [Pirellulales bacterium]